MAQKALPKMKMKQIIAYGLCVAFNLYLAPSYGIPQAGALSILMAIVLPFGVVLGEPVFKLITPQKHYIEKSKVYLIINEFFVHLFMGTLPYIILSIIFFS